MCDAARTSIEGAAALACDGLRVNAGLIPTRRAAERIEIANGGAAIGIVAVRQAVHRVACSATGDATAEAIGVRKVHAVGIPGGIAAGWVDGTHAFAARFITAGRRLMCLIATCSAAAATNAGDGRLVGAGLIPHNVAATRINIAHCIAAVRVGTTWTGL